MDIRTWYSASGVAVPTSFGGGAVSFAEHSSGIVRSIIDNRLSIVFTHNLLRDYHGFALADQENKVIVIDADLLSPSEAGKELRLKVARREIAVHEALAMVQGIVVHESLHFLLSPASLQAFKHPKIAFNELYASVANVVEDVYIENYGVTNFPQLAWMITSSWDVSFPPATLDEFQSAWDGEAPTNNEELTHAFNVLVTYKHQHADHKTRTEFEVVMHEILFSVLGESSLAKRIEIVAKLYAHMIQAMPKKSESEEGESEEGESEKGDSEKGDSEKGDSEKGDSEKGDSEKGEGEEEGEGSEATTPENVDDSQLSVDAQNEVSHIIIKRLLEELKEEIEAQRQDRFTFENVESLGESAGTLVTRANGEAGATLDFDSKWLALAKVSTARAASRSIAGPASFSGRKLTHPENLFTNEPNKYGKVWSSTRIESDNGSINLGKAKVVLLVDCSGSMAGRSGHTSKIVKAIASAYGMTVAFEKAGIKLAVYGFTTVDLPTGEYANMIVFKDFNDSYRSGKEALASALDTMREKMQNNPDSVAVEFATKRLMVGGAGTKVLIVISDGQPAAYMYKNTAAAIELTHDAVGKARSLGIKVFSISVDASAVLSCNEIYGQKANVVSEDPNTAVQTILKGIF